MTRKRIVRETGTFARHMGGGFVRTVNGAAWLYMRMPDQPSVTDASGMEERLKAARPMLSILGGLADRTPRVPFAGIAGDPHHRHDRPRHERRPGKEPFRGYAGLYRQTH